MGTLLEWADVFPLIKTNENKNLGLLQNEVQPRDYSQWAAWKNQSQTWLLLLNLLQRYYSNFCTSECPPALIPCPVLPARKISSWWAETQPMSFQKFTSVINCTQKTTFFWWLKGYLMQPRSYPGLCALERGPGCFCLEGTPSHCALSRSHHLSGSWRLFPRANTFCSVHAANKESQL